MSRHSAEPRAPRIGYVLKKFPRLSETFVLNELLGLEQDGVETAVVSLRFADEGRFHAALGSLRADVRYMPQFKSQAVFDAFTEVAQLGPGGLDAMQRALAFLDRVRPERRCSLLFQALHLVRSVRELELDHLHAHFMTVAAHTAFLAHLLTGTPFSVTAHAKDIYRTTVDAELFGEVAASAAAVVTVCEANRRYIEERLLRGRPARVVTIYNGIPELEARAATPRDPRLILAVGRLVEKKGVNVLLEACRLLLGRGVPFRCRVIGDGDQRRKLEEQCAAYGLEGVVSFAGARPREQILSEMAHARVLAAPCIVGADGNRDALPTVLIEALAMGLPAVTTPIGGIPEIVDDGVDGLLVPSSDAEALADGLEALLTDDDRWRRLAGNAPAKVRERFRRSDTLPRLRAVFEESAGSRRAAGVAS